jgi:tripartite-type tricarboxylate transporter receptor subunit TctC
MTFLKQYLVTVVLLCLSTFALAAETINIVWGFNIGSNQANTVRYMIEDLNKSQDKYQFVLVSKPGAGGTIAANAVTSSPQNTVVSMSSSFIIRPLFEKKEPTHNLDNFIPILIQGSGSPLVFVSSKYQTIEQVLGAKNLSIGVSGIGSITHLAANEFSNKNRSVQIVNFKNTIEASTAAAGGHVDVAVGFAPDVQPLIDAKKLRVIGYTGATELPGQQNLLLAKHGLRDSIGLTANYAVFASKEMDPSRRTELHLLLLRANFRPAVIESYHRDQIIVSALNLDQSLIWYNTERGYWKKQVEKINGVQ